MRLTTRTRPLIWIPLTLTVLFCFSWQAIGLRLAHAAYDGETLFRGLFFLSKPFSSTIPTLKKITRYVPPEYRALEEPVVRSIRKRQPDFFDRFGRELQSGDRVRVADVLKAANRLARDAIAEVWEQQGKGDLARRLKSTDLTKKPQPDIDQNVAVFVVVAIVVILLVVAVLVRQRAQIPADLKGLKFDIYVDEVVRALPRNAPAPAPAP